MNSSEMLGLHEITASSSHKAPFILFLRGFSISLTIENCLSVPAEVGMIDTISLVSIVNVDHLTN